MFATKGELNQSSAGAIPINNMYSGEDERQAAIPPPLDTSEETIAENAEEQNVDSADRNEQSQPVTGVTVVDQANS